jgi:hypothetical protein
VLNVIPAAELIALNPTHRVWAMSEFVVKDGPASANPFDPDVLALDALFTGPGGQTVRLPAFWYQPYTHELKDKKEEVLTAAGKGGWRVRFTPVEAGTHGYRLVATRDGKSETVCQGTFEVGAKAESARGFVRVEPKSKRYFMTDDGQPLPLLGECCCWHGRQRGTYDYDDWFADFTPNGMNYTRLWMCPWAFGIETVKEERTRYDQQHAWQLDRVMGLAADQGIFIMLCLDYHGIFNVKPDMWGGNNWWPKHAYNQANGGPCANQNEFFTNPEAARLYRKRLRYLVGRYSAYPSLMSWQFFNEINNVFRFLKPKDVVAWHDRMGKWLAAHDPYRHPRTTSFGSKGEYPPMWKLASMDYANWHLYLNWAGKYRHPAAMAEDVATRFTRDYGKPVCISEYGTSGKGWKPEIDPHLRGLQQAVWGGIMAGTSGTCMPWWWEKMHAEKIHGKLWLPLSRFLAGTGFGGPDWKPLRLPKPSGRRLLGPRKPGKPFTARIACGGNWGDRLPGFVALANPDEGRGALHVFLHGREKADLRVPCRIQAELADGASLTVHVNSASNAAELAVLVDGKQVFHRPFPNKDGSTKVNGEYDEDVTVKLPSGRHEIEVANPGGDWLALDWVQVAGALPCEMESPKDEPKVLSYAMTDGKQALLWVIDPNYNYPNGAKDDDPRTLSGATVRLPGLPDGTYELEFWDTWGGQATGKARGQAKAGSLLVAFPPFQVDTAVRIRPVQ